MSFFDPDSNPDVKWEADVDLLCACVTFRMSWIPRGRWLVYETQYRTTQDHLESVGFDLRTEIRQQLIEELEAWFEA